MQEVAMHPAQLARETLKLLATQRIEPTAENYSRLYNELSGKSPAHAPVAELGVALGKVLAHVRELVAEDEWLASQFDKIQACAQQESLSEVERRLRQLAAQHGSRRAGLAQAREQLKRMVSMFVDQMANVAQSTGEYSERIGELSHKVGAVQDVSELSGLLAELGAHSQSMQQQLTRNRDELIKARTEVESTQEKVRSLEQELVSLSEQVREDPLTRALNRRGLEEGFRREAARSARHKTALSLGLIDIDHFKRLNDTYGHQAGDLALQHLTGVIKESMRPTDQLARIGGEEFVLLLPDTSESNAKTALVRLQRELTKRLFLQQEQRWVITFSAGVTQFAPGEDLKDLLQRADAALYQAKQQGRNLVLIAATQQPAPARQPDQSSLLGTQIS